MINEDKNKSVLVVLSRELEEEIKDLATNESRSLSNYIRMVLEKHVKELKLKGE
jgi:predicted DNA-binding protein